MQFIKDTVLQDEIKHKQELCIYLIELHDLGVLGTVTFSGSQAHCVVW